MAMVVQIEQITDRSLALDAALNTVNKPPKDKEPSNNWWRKMLVTEHSPIRLVQYRITLKGIPSFVSVHLTRHKIGVEHFVSTRRDDRGDFQDNGRNTLVDHVMVLNAQAYITICRKRLCTHSHASTVKVWKRVMKIMQQVDPILANIGAPDCVYRGYCPEFTACNVLNSPRYKVQREYLIQTHNHGE